MKISIQNFLKGAAAVAQGTMLGKVQGQQEQSEEEYRDFSRMAQVVQMQQSVQDRQAGRELQRVNMLGGLLNSDFVDDESGAQLFQQYQQGIQGLGQPPAGGDPTAVLMQHPFIRRQAGKMGIPAPTPGTPQPGAQAPPSGASAVPSANPSAPGAPGTPPGAPGSPSTLKFRGPRERKVEGLVAQRLQRIQGAADQNEDQETAQAVLGIQTRLTRREITPDQALIELDGIEQQGRVSSQVLTDFRQQRDRWDQYRAQGMITDAALPQVNQILGEMTAIGVPNTPEKRQKAQALLQQLGEISKRPDVMQANSVARFNEDNTDYRNFVGAKGEIEKSLDQLRQGKGLTPEWVLGNVRTLDTFLKHPKNQKWGYKPPVDFDLNPREVDRTVDGKPTKVKETEAETIARNLTAAARYTEDEGAKRQILKGAYDKVFDLVKSGTVSDKRQQASLIHSLNDIADELGIEVEIPKDLKVGLTPEQQLLQEERVKNRQHREKVFGLQSREAQARERDREFNRGLRVRAQNFQERMAKERLSFDKQKHKDQKDKAGKSPDEHKATFERIKTLADDIDEFDKKIDDATGPTGLYGPLVTRNSPKMREEANKTLGPWLEQRRKLTQERDRLISTLPGGKKAFQGRVDGGSDPNAGAAGKPLQFQYGGRSYSVNNNYPNRQVPTPGKPKHDYTGKFGSFDTRVLQIAMGVAGDPTKEAQFRAKFPDPAAANLYLWEARFKMSQRGTGAK